MCICSSHSLQPLLWCTRGFLSQLNSNVQLAHTSWGGGTWLAKIYTPSQKGQFRGCLYRISVERGGAPPAHPPPPPLDPALSCFFGHHSKCRICQLPKVWDICKDIGSVFNTAASISVLVLQFLQQCVPEDMPLDPHGHNKYAR